MSTPAISVHNDSTTVHAHTEYVDPDHVLNVAFSDAALVLFLGDGCVLSVPLIWYPALHDATRSARDNWQLDDGGFAIHWPDIGQSLSVAAVLAGGTAA